MSDPNEKLSELIAKAKEAVANMTQDELEAMLAEQRKSWVRGEMAMGESVAPTPEDRGEIERQCPACGTWNVDIGLAMRRRGVNLDRPIPAEAQAKHDCEAMAQNIKMVMRAAETEEERLKADNKRLREALERIVVRDVDTKPRFYKDDSERAGPCAKIAAEALKGGKSDG